MKQILFFLLLLSPLTVLAAHGTEYIIHSDRTLKIEALYDSGAPFAGSPVFVFPPGQPEAEYTIETDDKGMFYFTPDRAGTWILQVRGEDGHGLRINLPVDEEMVSTLSSNNSYSTIQKIIMALCVLWGAAGTALYFRKRR